MMTMERARRAAAWASVRLRAAGAAAFHELTRPEPPPPDPVRARPTVAEVTRSIGNDWTTAPYYDLAEPEMDKAWTELIWPFISDCDFTSVVDLAAGHGRNTEKLLQVASRVRVADIN